MGNSHISTKQSEKGLERTLDAAWLPLTAQIGRVANEWAGRSDLVAYVGDDGGQGLAAAIFVPDLAEIEVNKTIAFGPKADPAKIGNFEERETQFDHLCAAGATFHEAMHARHTTFNMEHVYNDLKGERGVYDAVMLLEESRIEAKGVMERPENRAFLRASALEIVLADLDSEENKTLSDTRVAAQVAGLALSRVDAGVLDETDVEAARDQVKELITPETLEKLQNIWIEFQAINYPEYQTDDIYRLAREWVKVVEEQAKDNGEPEPGEGEGGEGQPGEKGQPGSAVGKALRDALREDADVSAIGAQTEASDQQKAEEDEREVEAAKADAAEQDDNQETAKRVFDGKEDNVPDGTNSRSRLVKKRPPTEDEQAAAVTIGKELDKARYRDREVVKVKASLPPGRLRGNAVLARKAMKSKGINKQVDPWSAKRRTRTDEPKLSLGVMVDISGSMGSAMLPMSVTAWIMSEAARRVQAKVGMVYYGYDVFPTLYPGQHLDEVHIYTAPDGTEKFDKAFRALDGQMNMLNGKGARLLVIVSDGQYTPEEQERCKHWIKRCEQRGVGVLWVGMPDCANHWAKSYCENSSAEFILSTGGVADAALQIGSAAAKAITLAGERRVAQ